MTIENIETPDVEDSALEAAIAEANERELNFQRPDDRSQTEAPQQKEKPEGVPEEFWDADKGAVDWTKLNAKLSGKADEGEETPEAAETGWGEVNGHKLTEQHAQDFAPFYEQFDKDGTVPDEAVAYVEKTFGMKVSKEVLAGYIAGQSAKAKGSISEQSAALRSEALSIVGGEEAYGEIAAWAADTLTEAEQREYNEAVESGNRQLVRMAVQALHNRYRAEADVLPRTTLNNTRTSTSRPGDSYGSVQEYFAAVQSPKYANDPVYRAKVDEKLARSGHLNIPG